MFRASSTPGGRIIPQDVRSFQRHNCSAMLGNQSWRVVGCGPSRRNTCGVREAVRRTGEALAAVHRMPRKGATVLAFCVQLRTHGVGIEVAKENLSLEEVLPIFLF